MDFADIDLVTQRLAGLPIINSVIEKLALNELLERFVPHDDARVRLAPAAALGVVIRNLVTHREPVYALGEWAKPFDPAVVGLAPGEAELLNDDRVGRMLERLFYSDRASLLTRLVLDAVASYQIDLSRLHNDSTSLTFAGAHRAADGRERGGKATAVITHGHNKDGRPDLKQLVWILTVTADGAVPITYRAVDGNTSDATTHIATWDELVALTGRAGFLYVADCKLATRENMDHIHKRGGRFLSVLPATRKEDKAYREWLVTHEPEWLHAATHASRYLGAPDDVWHTTEAPWPSAEGHRIVWLRSSAARERDASNRHDTISAGIHALDALNQRLASPKRRLRTIEAVHTAASKALKRARADRYVHFTIEETTVDTVRQEKRGRPGKDTRYRKITRLQHRVRWSVNEQHIAHDAASDGCWPLISNERAMTGAQLLAAYK